MYSWRITKYDPVCRNDEGYYLKDDWTSISDIGRLYNGKELTITNYLAVEDLYVYAVISFMKCLKITSLMVSNLERYLQIDDMGVSKYPQIYSKDMVTLFETVRNDDSLGLHEVENMCRLILREDRWCKLRFKSTMFVHFGHDYYMYIGSSLKCSDVIEAIKDSGLFVEPFKSPHR